mmetsp:Transcript_14705/g.26317  ORF Transcript_14705/g.26317 Transcript_14705/m.26317 type:complete len:438 (+) Transcript_14705:131-1444(+)
MSQHSIRDTKKSYHAPTCKQITAGIEFSSGTLDIIVNPTNILLQRLTRQSVPVRMGNVGPRQRHNVRTVHDSSPLEGLSTLDSNIFMPTLDDSHASIIRQLGHRLLVHAFDLTARKAKVAGYVEDAPRLVEFGGGARDDVTSQHGPTFHFDVGYGSEFAFIDAAGLVDVTGFVGEGEGDGAVFEELGGDCARVFARAKNETALAHERLVFVFEHFFGEEDYSLSGDLRILLFHERHARTRALRIKSLILTKQISHLLLTHAHPHRGMINVRTNIFGQLRHITLTKTLHFRLALIERIKVTAPHGTPHVVPRQSIREHIIKPKSLDQSPIYMWAEVQRTLIWPQRTRILNAKSAIQPHHAHVVHPRDAELHETFRFHQLLRHEGVTRIAVEKRTEAFHCTRYRIDVLDLVRVATVGLGDEEFGCLEAGFEADVALSSE